LLRTVSLATGALAVVLSGGVLWVIRDVEGRVADLSIGMSYKAVLATAFMRTVDETGLKIGHFFRTRNAAERQAALDGFRAAVRAFSTVRVEQSADPTGGETVLLMQKSLPLAQRWEEAFHSTAKYSTQLERSARGIASQCSLLNTLCLQLATDDGTAGPGARAPAHGPTSQAALGLIGDVQNAVLFASSQLDATQLERAFAGQAKFAASVGEVLAATAPSDCASPSLASSGWPRT
jgi:hypothetical protein